MKTELMFVVGLVLSATCQAGNQNDWEIFQQRLISTQEAGGDKLFQSPYDARSLVPEWNSNPARASLKYGKRATYVATVKRVNITNGSDADLIIDAGKGKEITVVLFPMQPKFSKTSGKWQVSELLSTMEYAAEVDQGDRFVFECKNTVPVLNQLYLNDCIAYPPEVANTAKQ